MEHVYKFKWDCGNGSVESIFVATEESVAKAIGFTADFGEILGKHSEVYGTLEKDEITLISSNPVIIDFVKEKGAFGPNPLEHVSVECETCASPIEISKVQIYWCPSCEGICCYDCAGGEDHETCDEIVTYAERGKRPDA